MSNYNGTQINQSVTIVEKAGAAITDVRNRLLAFDNNGDVVLATDGTKPIVGVALIEAGQNDITGVDSGKVAKGEDVDIQVKDIGVVLCGGTIAKGAAVTAGAGGEAVAASSGDFVIGFALSAGAKDKYATVQISKFKN